MTTRRASHADSWSEASMLPQNLRLFRTHEIALERALKRALKRALVSTRENNRESTREITRESKCEF